MKDENEYLKETAVRSAAEMLSLLTEDYLASVLSVDATIDDKRKGLELMMRITGVFNDNKAAPAEKLHTINFTFDNSLSGVRAEIVPDVEDVEARTITVNPPVGLVREAPTAPLSISDMTDAQYALHQQKGIAETDAMLSRLNDVLAGVKPK